jgi:hypothetical protein
MPKPLAAQSLMLALARRGGFDGGFLPTALRINAEIVP